MGFGEITAMLLFPEYQLSERAAARHVEATRRLGLLPIFVTLVLMLARNANPGPGLWCALGLSIGLELLLWGAYAICLEKDLRSRTATYFALTADAWFPLFLFTMQNGFVFISAAVLLVTIEELGFPATLLENSLIILLILLLPAYRLASEKARVTESTRWALTSEGCRYFAIAIGAVWMASTITLFLAPPGTPLSHEFFPIAVILWVLAAVVILVCLMLFADHVLKAR